MKKPFKTIVEESIFATKWLLLPFYVGLMIALCVYGIHFAYQVYLMVVTFGVKDTNTIMMTALELVDITMIANLIKMIITGSYTSFVNKSPSDTSEKASSGMLKVKMSTSLVGVSAIHLLQSFLMVDKISWDNLYKQIAIHISFLIGSVALAYIEYLHEKGDAIERKSNTKYN